MPQQTTQARDGNCCCGCLMDRRIADAPESWSSSSSSWKRRRVCVNPHLLHNKRQQECRRYLAQRIALSRILRQYKDPMMTTTPAFYRRPNQLIGSHNAYESCIVLDPFASIVVACDVLGRMDIIRLPSSSSFTTNQKNHRNDPDDNHDGISSMLLAEKLSIMQSPPLWDDPQQPSIGGGRGGYYLQSIDQGNAFCVGMSNGDFVMFATERASTTTTTTSRPLCRRAVEGRTSSFSSSLVRGFDNMGTAATIYQTTRGSGSIPFIEYARIISSSLPVWRNVRHHRINDMHLDQHHHHHSNNNREQPPWMVVSQRFQNYHTPLLEYRLDDFMYDHDDSEGGKRQRSMFDNPNLYRWAFQELSSSSAILAAHVDRDCSLSVMDSRVTHHKNHSSIHLTTSNSSSSSPPSHHHQQQQVVTSVGWISEHHLLTSHQMLSPNNSPAATNNMLKVWDIRRNTHKPVSEHTMIMSLPQQYDSTSTSSSSYVRATPQPNGVIRRVQTSSNQNGTVLVTTQYHSNHRHPVVRSSSSWTEYQLLDIGTWQVIQMIRINHHRHREANNIQRESSSSIVDVVTTTSNTSSRITQPPDALIDAVTPHLDCLASYEYDNNSHSIAFYDLKSRYHAGMKEKAFSKKKQTHHVVRLGVKRTMDYRGCVTSMDDDESRSMMVGQFAPHLQDGNSLPTRLSCMAVDNNGTTWIGGSLDGDLFVWRG